VARAWTRTALADAPGGRAAERHEAMPAIWRPDTRTTIRLRTSGLVTLISTGGVTSIQRRGLGSWGLQGVCAGGVDGRKTCKALRVLMYGLSGRDARRGGDHGVRPDSGCATCGISAARCRIQRGKIVGRRGTLQDLTEMRECRSRRARRAIWTASDAWRPNRA